MPSIPSIRIPFSKTTTYFTIFGCLIFVGLGYLITLIPYEPAANEPNYGLYTGLGFIGFFGLLILINLRRLTKDPIGLIIDERGITDQTYGYSVGLIEWRDIESIDVFKIRINLFPIKALLIKVHDPQKYIDRAEGMINRKMCQTNQLGYGTPISITSMPLKCSFSQMEKWIRERWEQSKI